MKKQKQKQNKNLEELIEEIEKKWLFSSPKCFFDNYEQIRNCKKGLIWKEFIEWQKMSGRIREFKIKTRKENGRIYLSWWIENELFFQALPEEIDIELYKQGIKAVYSFMLDRPQYYRFRRLDGLCNPLNLLMDNWVEIKK